LRGMDTCYQKIKKAIGIHINNSKDFDGYINTENCKLRCYVLQRGFPKILWEGPEIIQVGIVEDIDDLRKWTDIINIALCGCEIMSFEQFYDIYCHDNTQFFLALYDGIPAAVSMTKYRG